MPLDQFRLIATSWRQLIAPIDNSLVNLLCLLVFGCALEAVRTVVATTLYIVVHGIRAIAVIATALVLATVPAAGRRVRARVAPSSQTSGVLFALPAVVVAPAVSSGRSTVLAATVMATCTAPESSNLDDDTFQMPYHSSTDDHHDGCYHSPSGNSAQRHNDAPTGAASALSPSRSTTAAQANTANSPTRAAPSEAATALTAPVSLTLPPHALHHSRLRCALDIGGTLAKVVVIRELWNSAPGLLPLSAAVLQESRVNAVTVSPLCSRRRRNLDLVVRRSDQPSFLYLQFSHFSSNEVPNILYHFSHLLMNGSAVQPPLAAQSRKECSGSKTPPLLPVTGGGAYKFQAELENRLGVHVYKVDEMKSAIRGLSFVLDQPHELYSFDVGTRTKIPIPQGTVVYPFILVNIGSGVSVLKVDNPSKFERITGTCVGGGTVMGLARLLLNVGSYREVLSLAEKGSECLDLKVSDIFGDSAGSQCFPGDTLASSFGRLYTKIPSSRNARGSLYRHDSLRHLRREDVARSIVRMVSYNLGYLGYLLSIIHRTPRVIFAGKYINNQPLIMEEISYGLRFYTQHYCCAYGHCQQLRDSCFNFEEPANVAADPKHDSPGDLRCGWGSRMPLHQDHSPPQFEAPEDSVSPRTTEKSAFLTARRCQKESDTDGVAATLPSQSIADSGNKSSPSRAALQNPASSVLAKASQANRCHTVGELNGCKPHQHVDESSSSQLDQLAGHNVDGSSFRKAITTNYGQSTRSILHSPSGTSNEQPAFDTSTEWSRCRQCLHHRCDYHHHHSAHGGPPQALFLCHDGYLGALGALLAPMESAARPDSVGAAVGLSTAPSSCSHAAKES